MTTQSPAEPAAPADSSAARPSRAARQQRLEDLARVWGPRACTERPDLFGADRDCGHHCNNTRSRTHSCATCAGCLPCRSYGLRTRAAKDLCQDCTLAGRCGAAALASKEPIGVWGGLSTEDRRALNRRNSGRARPDPAATTTAPPHSIPDEQQSHLDCHPPRRAS